jgi:GAF domain-containing protein
VDGEPGTRLLAACVALADTLEEDSRAGGVLESLAEWCVELVGVDAAGLLLADGSGPPVPDAASCDHARLLGLAEQEYGAGPGLDCLRRGTPVAAADLAGDGLRWAGFTAQALEYGYTAAFAVPMRRQEEVIGALCLFRATPGPLSRDAAVRARALADAATVGVLQRRARHRYELLSAQLQTALDSRVLVEQAKGLLAERWNMDVDDAFLILRRHARTRRMRLADLSRAVLTRAVDLSPDPAP